MIYHPATMGGNDKGTAPGEPSPPKRHNRHEPLKHQATASIVCDARVTHVTLYPSVAIVAHTSLKSAHR